MTETNRDRDESGQFTETITKKDIIEVFDKSDPPFLTAAELGNELSISRQAANYRLKRMCKDGIVDYKQTGARSVVWWVTK